MAPAPSSLSPAGRALALERAVFDTHADSLQRALDLGDDLGVRGRGQLDLERGLEGGLGALVFVCWVDPEHLQRGPGAAFQRTLALLRELHRLVRRHPARVGIAGNAATLRAAHARGAVAAVPGVEGGHSIEEDPRKLEALFEHGVRVFTLVWNNHLPWIRSCRDGAGAGVPAGLSAFGRELVGTMNRLGILVDLSHAGERSFYDALEASERAPIASHSGCRALHDHPRNLTDDQLRALGRRGGVAGIVFCTAFLDAAAREEEARLRASEAFRAIGGASEAERFLRESEFLQREATPLSIERVAEHVCHAVEVAGIDHVGIGSDFDGIQRVPQGLEDASRYPALADALLGRGFSLDDVRKVLGGNMRRVFEAATGPGTRAEDAPLAPLDG
ncbi:MAG TPA: dipeptidase [Planctomycetota bacterium]|nr:dipeptidase [Planctomycetota bacterium]